MVAYSAINVGIDIDISTISQYCAPGVASLRWSEAEAKAAEELAAVKNEHEEQEAASKEEPRSIRK